MEQLPGGAARYGHHPRRVPPSPDRFLRTLQPPPPSAAAPPLELTEDDIFSTPMECLPPSPARPIPIPIPNPKPAQNYGVLAALNSSLRSRSGSNAQPVFNHKASPPTSAVVIPRLPPIQRERDRFGPRSAPVDIPVMPAIRRRAREMEEAFSEGEEDMNGLILPPHEVVDSRNSPILACSVMEGTGRTLKGRDLRQVRNAIFRKTGFID